MAKLKALGFQATTEAGGHEDGDRPHRCHEAEGAERTDVVKIVAPAPYDSIAVFFPASAPRPNISRNVRPGAFCSGTLVAGSL
jgi:hypothetical protein